MKTQPKPEARKRGVINRTTARAMAMETAREWGLQRMRLPSGFLDGIEAAAEKLVAIHAAAIPQVASASARWKPPGNAVGEQAAGMPGETRRGETGMACGE